MYTYVRVNINFGMLKLFVRFLFINDGKKIRRTRIMSMIVGHKRVVSEKGVNL